MPRILNIARWRGLALHCALLLSLAAVACERVPLLAPTGSVITLTAAATAVPTNGTAQLIAQVLEPSGTPPHSGTQVIFTTTLGTIEPTETETDINGRAVVMFRAGTANGTATITASSGGSSVATANVGNAAVGSLSLIASPTTLPAGGGTSTIAATVFDISGNVLPGVNVSFSTDGGAVGPSSATTNGNGVATTSLTATRTTKVTATAGVGASGATGGTGSTGGGVQTKDVTVTVNVGPSISLGAVTPNPAVAGQAVTLSLTITAPGATQSPVRSVVVNWGDGQQTQAGSSTGTLSHVYFAPGTYTITAVATDTNGDSSTATSFVSVTSATPSVGIVPSTDNPAANTTVTFTISATIPGAPAGVAIQNVFVDFGDGKSASLGTATSVPHTYTSPGTYTATATVTTTVGTTATGSTTITVK
jgi:adhesin/invasin